MPDDLLAAHGGALALDGARSQDLLQDRYGQVYLGSTWRRGFPGALNRSRPQYTWIVDTLAGWQWTEKEFNYGIDLGIGMGCWATTNWRSPSATSRLPRAVAAMPAARSG